MEVEASNRKIITLTEDRLQNVTEVLNRCCLIRPSQIEKEEEEEIGETDL